MKHSFQNRIRITKTGKIIRRPMGIGHSKAKKSGLINQKKRKNRGLLGIELKVFKQYV